MMLSRLISIVRSEINPLIKDLYISLLLLNRYVSLTIGSAQLTQPKIFPSTISESVQNGYFSCRKCNLRNNYSANFSPIVSGNL